MNRPLDGFFPITQHYGENHADYARFGLKGHNGVDYGCPSGTPVMAVLDGVVERAQGDPNGYGLHVKLKHAGGLWTIYGHFGTLYVTTGQVVRAGEVLGLSGNTGNSTGPHLHFEIRVAGQERNGYGVAVDPLTFEAQEKLSDNQVMVMVDGVNIRSAPGLFGTSIIGKANHGLILTRAGDTIEVDGLTWQPVTVYIAKGSNGVQYLTW